LNPTAPPLPLIPANAGTQIIKRGSPMSFYVYIVTNQRNGAVYTGMTDSLAERIWQHKIKAYRGFTAKHDCNRLVWYEVCDTREAAFLRERRIREWRRSWKLMLIEERNPTWADLYETLNC
jgi:putative endonuclease